MGPSARSSTWPSARRDPSSLERENLEIVASGEDDARALPATRGNLDAVAAGRLFVRQKPGPKNSLGLAEFIFPNRNNVYMHGTPAQSLFSRTRRDFSHSAGGPGTARPMGAAGRHRLDGRAHRGRDAGEGW